MFHPCDPTSRGRHHSAYLERRLTHLLARGVTTIREPSPYADFRTTVLPLRDRIRSGEVLGSPHLRIGPVAVRRRAPERLFPPGEHRRADHAYKAAGKAQHLKATTPAPRSQSSSGR